jgi:poly(3-hydroxybutyrate) depolymerase
VPDGRGGERLLKDFLTNYGAEQKKPYFAGCSQGGRMGLMEALRGPKDFDGIISGAPALDNTGLYNLFAWVANALRAGR